jgi:hypothetical protein
MLALLIGALAFATCACLCTLLCLWACMRRRVQPTPPPMKPPQPDKFTAGDKWLAWVPPDSKPEPMWWHAADSKPELVEPEPPAWSYKDPNPLAFDKTVIYGDSAQALRVDVHVEEFPLHPEPPRNDFVFGEHGKIPPFSYFCSSV